MNMVWTTKEGKKLSISEMSTTHLFNTIKMLDRQKSMYPNSSIYKALKKELKTRMANNEPNKIMKEIL